MAEIDWDSLREIATGAMRPAYAPYSDFPVGAAALGGEGRGGSGWNGVIARCLVGRFAVRSRGATWRTLVMG